MSSVNKKPYRLDQKLPFGKYKMFTVKDVIDMDYGYMAWFNINVSNFRLNKEAMDYMVKKGKKYYKDKPLPEKPKVVSPVEVFPFNYFAPKDK